MKEGGGITHTNTYTTQHVDTDNSVVIAREKGGSGQLELGKVGLIEDRERLCLGWWVGLLSVQLMFC